MVTSTIEEECVLNFISRDGAKPPRESIRGAALTTRWDSVRQTKAPKMRIRRPRMVGEYRENEAIKGRRRRPEDTGIQIS